MLRSTRQAHGPYSFRLITASCAAVLQGECWGSVDGMAQPVHLAAGDCFLLNRGTGITLSTDPSLPPQDSSAVLEAIEREGIAVHNGVLLIGAFFSFPNDHAAMLLDALPSFVNSPHLTRQADIQRWALDQLKSELLEPLPGGMLVANHLLHLMLVQMLRHHLTTLSPPANRMARSAVRSPDLCSNSRDAHRPGAPLVAGRTRSCCRAFSHGLCSAVQGDRRRNTDELSHAMAYADGNEPIARHHRKRRVNRIRAWLRV